MELNKYIQTKFINEAADVMIDSLSDYSDYIEENNNLGYYYELAQEQRIGYNNCSNFMLEADRNENGFTICRDYVNDFKNIMGENPSSTDINSEFIYQFYLDTFIGWLCCDLESKSDDFTNNNKIISLIEKWRHEQTEEVNKITF